MRERPAPRRGLAAAVCASVSLAVGGCASLDTAQDDTRPVESADVVPDREVVPNPLLSSRVWVAIGGAPTSPDVLAKAASAVPKNGQDPSEASVGAGPPLSHVPA